MRTILLVLPGGTDPGAVDYYQLLQKETAIADAAVLGLALEVVHAPGFDHLRVVRKRLSETSASAVDAVVIEPGSLSSTDLLLNDVKGRAGLILLNAWSPAVEEHAASWGAGLPIGTVSTDHAEIGRIQALQVNAAVPDGGTVLCVTGTLRSSAARQRLDALRSALKAGLTLHDTEAGDWTEEGGARAFESWYGLFRSRRFELHAIAAQSDELAVGARRAALALAASPHREMLAGAKLMGVMPAPATESAWWTKARSRPASSPRRTRATRSAGCIASGSPASPSACARSLDRCPIRRRACAPEPHGVPDARSGHCRAISA